MEKIKTFTGSGSFDVREEMLKDSTDLLDNVEVTTVAQECVKLKQKEDEIAALESIDVLWIGHFDLTNSMGIPGQFDHPDFEAAVSRVVEACEKHGKAAGFLTSSLLPPAACGAAAPLLRRQRSRR